MGTKRDTPGPGAVRMFRAPALGQNKRGLTRDSGCQLYTLSTVV